MSDISIKGYSNLILLVKGAEACIYTTPDNKIIKVCSYGPTKICCCSATRNHTKENVMRMCTISKDLSIKIPEYVPVIYDIIEGACPHGRPFIALVMEYIPGTLFMDFFGNIQPVLDDNPKSPEYTFDRIIRLVTNFIGAVRAVQSCGYAHGDLNFSNIMILPDDKIKIFDFGWSAALTNANAKYDLLKGKSIIDTIICPLYDWKPISYLEYMGNNMERSLMLWNLSKYLTSALINDRMSHFYKDIPWP